MNIPEYDVTGRKVLLIGAARGIGKGVASVRAEAGADIAIASLNIDSASAAVKEIQSAGGKAVAYAADVHSVREFQRASELHCPRIVSRPGADDPGSIQPARRSPWNRCRFQARSDYACLASSKSAREVFRVFFWNACNTYTASSNLAT